jgi:hypothetical protein
MKKISIILLSVVFLTACVDSLEEYNVDQKRSSLVPARTLFTNAMKGITDVLTTPSVNTNNFRLYTQQWTTTTYLNEPRYNMVARTYSQSFWQAIYRDVLADLKESKRLIEEDELLDPVIKNNQLGLVGIMEVYSWAVLVNTFGDVPYSEALDFTISLPKYDDAMTIYNDLVTRLDASLALLTSGTSFGAGDILYGGDVAKWMRFGNSLKLKLGLLIVDADAGKAKALVEQAAPNVLASNADNAIFKYTASPNNNPISQNLNPIFTSREDFVVASTIVDPMNTLSDPRRPFYFTQVGGTYVGGKYGFSNTYADFSHPSDKIIATTFEAILMDYAEIEFGLAEAAERGFTVPGTAAEHYANGVRSSILYWGGTDAEATAYLAQPAVAYATATGNYKQKIGFQKWLALYNRGWEAWVEWRRLDAPLLVPPSGEGIVSELKIPVRMIYPVSEQTQNGSQRNAAAEAIGSDEPTTKLFWDKN